MTARAAHVELPPLPVIEPAITADLIVAFIRAQMSQTGFARIVVGLSGGVDSATVAFLATRAVGAENLLAVRMPYRTSSTASEADALKVVQALGCRTALVEITPMVEPLLALMGVSQDSYVLDDAAQVRRGNVMARQRMIVLYDKSVEFDGLVAGTSNKTEALLGYGTQYGDMAAALMPIGDLYKTQLRAVAEHLGVPAEIVAKPPSADLWPGQTDEGELGRTYEDLDRTLFALVDRRWTADRCVAAGLDRDLVEWVAARVARMEYKRQMPTVAKISLRTPGIDHLYPRRRPGSRRAT